MNIEKVFDKKIDFSDAYFAQSFDLDLMSLNKEEVTALIVTGFLGCAKTFFLNRVLNNINHDVLIFYYNISQSTNLDDILLEFFKKFVDLKLKNLIELPQSENDNFLDKVIHYFKSLNRTFVIAIDSFEQLQDNQKVLNEILSFLGYLTNCENLKPYLKFIFVSRSFEINQLKVMQIPFKHIIIRSLNEAQFFNFVQRYPYNITIKSTDVAHKVYKLTTGHFFYLNLLQKLSLLTKEDILSTISIFNLQKQNLINSLLGAFISKLSENQVKFLNFLAYLRVPISHQFVYRLNFLSSNELLQLIDYSILCKTFDGNIYLKDVIKQYILKTLIDNSTKLSINKFFIQLYKRQLELKPKERELSVSRVTSRLEIEYYKRNKEYIESQIVVGIGDIVKGSQKGLIENLSKETRSFWDRQRRSDDLSEQISGVYGNKGSSKSKVGKVDQLTMWMGDESSLGFLSNEKMLVAKLESNENEQNKKYEILINRAKEYEKQENYLQAIDVYEKILCLKIDESKKQSPLILTKMGTFFCLLNELSKSIACFKEALKFYINKEDSEKEGYILIQMANVYRQMLNDDQAKKIYQKLIDIKELLSSELNLLMILDFSQMENEPIKVFRLLKKYEEFAISTQDVKLKSSYYFKVAKVCFDLMDWDDSKLYLEKAIETENVLNPNKTLGKMFCLLSDICFELQDFESAKKYYKNTLSVDVSKNDADLLYYCTNQLCLIYKQEKDKKNLIKYLKLTRKCAKSLEDKFHLAVANLEIGDFYYNLKRDDIAFKYYFEARTVLEQSNSYSKDNVGKIDERIGDLKVRLGLNRFNFYLKKYKLKYQIKG